MGEKKRKEAEVARWKKVVVVGACILFVVLMVVSGMGFSWLTMFNTVKPGNAVTVDYTIYSAGGSPIITSSASLFQTSAAAGGGVVYSKPITISANSTSPQPIYSIPVFTASNGWGEEFALFASEYNTLSKDLIGLKVNEQKQITLPAPASMKQFWTADQLARNKVNMSQIQVGDVIAMGVSDNPQELATNKTAFSYIRIGEITQKTSSGIEVDFGYPRAVITVTAINSQS